MPNRHGSDVTPSESYKYGYNGKIKDNEIKGNGNSYDFGARMLDTRVARWLSVDPLEAKYPGFSPYNFVANSPLILIDPDGKEILIYQGPKTKPLIYTPGMAVTKDMNSFVAKTVENLNKINSKKKGHELIQELVDDKKSVLIKDLKGQRAGFKADNYKRATKKGVKNIRKVGLFGGNIGKRKIRKFRGNGKGSGGVLRYDTEQTQTKYPSDEVGGKDMLAYIMLAHELGHALQGFRGEMDNRRDPENNNGSSVRKTELFATHIENMIRSEQGELLRKNYGVSKGVPLSRHEIIDENGKSKAFTNSKGKPYDYCKDVVSDPKKF